ncbi:hypothetical protein [Streptomyces sp. NPDC102462]|uniref:hypothetical protein n=1 Tax=Streptomyces sp. NPDC102462 TaxID=3366178 RepID=UPI0037F4DF08
MVRASRARATRPGEPPLVAPAGPRGVTPCNTFVRCGYGRDSPPPPSGSGLGHSPDSAAATARWGLAPVRPGREAMAREVTRIVRVLGRPGT